MAKPPPRPLAVYNTYDARNLFSHLLRRVRAGEAIVIARMGEPIATIVPYKGVEELQPGLLRVHLLVNDGAPVDGAGAATPLRPSSPASDSMRE